MVVFQVVVSAIQTRPPSQWLTHENVFARELGLQEGDSYSAVDELNGFVSSIENGGEGVRSHGTFVANPKPLFTLQLYPIHGHESEDGGSY